MRLFKTLTSHILSGYYYVREKISPSRFKSGKEIPIIINNFNRLSSLLRLIDALTSCGYTRIYILDNASTYPPLLSYYESCPFEVIRLGRNLGFKALWKSHCRKNGRMTPSFSQMPMKPLPVGFAFQSGCATMPIYSLPWRKRTRTEACPSCKKCCLP